MNKLVALALCGATLLGGLGFWANGHHTAAATASPSTVHATHIAVVPSGVVPSAVVPTAARQTTQPPTRLSSYLFCFIYIHNFPFHILVRSIFPVKLLLHDHLFKRRIRIKVSIWGKMNEKSTTHNMFPNTTMLLNSLLEGQK
ncbi:hypothetical protein [Ktedonobacter sp. SOSP1-85]|uniref:hypothetical protein n=1 Tax=Ktedonobacter sp. SOSP1-85 TaxID=2778367 RepID=UPI0019166F18|nr:hypothetical protein [Ktedonobacter sp. SOSP1-85]